MSALDALLGQIAVGGQLIELRGVLNFADGFTHIDDPGMNTLHVAAPAPSATGKVTTTGAVATALIAAGNIPDNTISVVRVHIVGRTPSPGNQAMIYEVKQAYMKINAGEREGAFGAASVLFNVKDDAGWGTPTLVLTGDALTVKVTGAADTTIQWSGKVWWEFETLPTP